MAGDSAKFVVEFQADVAKLRKEMQGLKKDVADFNKGDKRTKNEQKKYTTDEQRRVKVDRRAKQKDQDQERKHVRLMGREKLSQDRAGSRERIRSMEQEVRAYQRLSKKGPLPSHMDPDGRFSQQRQRSRVTGGGLMGAAGAVGLGIGGFLVSAATSGYAKYNEMRVARARSIGLGATDAYGRMGKHPNRDVLNGMRKSGGGALGYSQIDVANMNPIMAQSTGHQGPRELMQGTRASGMEAGEVGSTFGMIRRAGYDFNGGGKGGSAGANQFKKLMSGAVQSGLEHARSGEFIDGISNLVEQQRQMTTGNIDITKIAAALSSWGASGKSGLQGGAGAALYGKVAGGITSPGGGEWGSSFMNQAMGFGKPGGTSSYYDAEKMRESAGRDPAVIEKAMKEFSKQFGGFGKGNKEEASLAMRESLGTTLEQNEALQDIYSSTKTSSEKQAEIAKIMEASQPLEKQSLEAMKGLGGGVKRIADLTNKGIELGAKAAPLIEKMEDWQHQFLEYLMQMATDIAYIANYFKDLVADKTGAKGATGDQLNDIGKLRKKLTDPNISEKDRQATMAMIKKREASARAGIEVQAEDMNSVTNMMNPWGTNKVDIMKQSGALDRESSMAAAQFQRSEQLAKVRKSGLLPKGMDARAQSDFVETGAAPPEMVDAMRGLKRKKGKMQIVDGGVVSTPDAPPPSQSGSGVGANSGGPPSNQSTVRVLVEQTSTDARVPAKTQQPQGGGRPAKPSSH